MAGLSARRSELEENDVSIIAASVDPLDKAKEVADEVYFPIGYGVTKDIADLLDSWWEERRQIIQPSEFFLGPDRKVLASSYSDGPIGRFTPDDVVSVAKFWASRV